MFFIDDISSAFDTVFGSKPIFISLSLATLAATIAVAIGLFFEYERHELRIFDLAGTRQLNLGKQFRTRRFHIAPRKSIGSFLVVTGVVLEALFGLMTFISAEVRETDSQEQILMLQKEMLPRHVDIFLHAISRLRQFSKMQVMLRTVHDTESRRVLFDLVQLLNKCGWQVAVQQEQSLSLTPDGIEIVYRAADAKDNARKAADALAAYLNLPEVGVANEVSEYPNQELWRWWPSNGPNDNSVLRLEPDSVTIFIGLRPVGDRPRNWMQPEKP